MVALIKFLPYIAIFGISFAGGAIFDSKVLTKRCPDCNPPPCAPCPPAVKLQTFDVSKIKNTKSTFVLNQSLSDVNIIIDCGDSTAIKKYLEAGK